MWIRITYFHIHLYICEHVFINHLELSFGYMCVCIHSVESVARSPWMVVNMARSRRTVESESQKNVANICVWLAINVPPRKNRLMQCVCIMCVCVCGQSKSKCICDSIENMKWQLKCMHSKFDDLRPRLEGAHLRYAYEYMRDIENAATITNGLMNNVKCASSLNNFFFVVENASIYFAYIEDHLDLYEKVAVVSTIQSEVCTWSLTISLLNGIPLSGFPCRATQKKGRPAGRPRKPGPDRKHAANLDILKLQHWHTNSKSFETTPYALDFRLHEYDALHGVSIS